MHYVIYLLLSVNLLFMQCLSNSGFQMRGCGILLGEILIEETGLTIEYASVTLIDFDSKFIVYGL